MGVMTGWTPEMWIQLYNNAYKGPALVPVNLQNIHETLWYLKPKGITKIIDPNYNPHPEIDGYWE